MSYFYLESNAGPLVVQPVDKSLYHLSYHGYGEFVFVVYLTILSVAQYRPFGIE
jgi:hypothetical protein